MTISRVEAETILVQRYGSLMTAANMDVTYAGANADLVDVLVKTLLSMGHKPVSLVAITNADLSVIQDADIPEFIARAELHLLQTVSGNLALVDITVGPRKESLSQLSEQVEFQIARIQKKVTSMYGDGLSTLEGGVLSLDFQETTE